MDPLLVLWVGDGPEGGVLVGLLRTAVYQLKEHHRLLCNTQGYRGSQEGGDIMGDTAFRRTADPTKIIPVRYRVRLGAK